MEGTIHMTFVPNPDDPKNTIVDAETNLRDVDPFYLADALAFVASGVSASSQGLEVLCSAIVTLAFIHFKERNAAEAGDPAEAEEPAAENKEESPNE